MSQQVYSSSTSKYQTYPGYNQYALTADRAIASGDLDIMTGYTNELTQQPTTSLAAEKLTILETGMYSVKAQVRIVPAAGYISADVNVLLLTTDNRNDTAIISNYIVDTVTTAAVPRQIDGVFTGWLFAGDTLTLRVQNQVSGLAPQVITVKAGATRFIVSRIY